MKLDLKKLTNEVIEIIQGKYGDMHERIVLYGSYARGDYDEESDVDFMVMVRCHHNETPKYRRELCRLASELSMKYGREVSFLLQDKGSFDYWRKAVVFFQNVEKDGVVLYG